MKLFIIVTNKWNLEHLSYDDQLQNKNLKVIGIRPTNLEVIDVEVFSEIWGKPKEKLQKFLAERKKRLESLAQVYIDDIHVMNVFFDWSHKKFLGICTILVGMRCHTTQCNTRIQWP